MTTSVIIASYRRGPKLRTCLLSLNAQTQKPDEVIVVWQGDDTATRDMVESCRANASLKLRLVHLATPGIVPAENEGLAVSTGQVVLLIDDDAIAPADWLAKHLAFYKSNPRCGAVGGGSRNFVGGSFLPVREHEPVGEIAWYGKHFGNMFDHIDAWRSRPPRRVRQVVGNNFSLRRVAFDRFEDQLLPYWQLFEMDACLQVAANGYEVWFDFSNVIEHHPSSQAYLPGRGGDLTVKVFNAAFNEAFVLSKFSPSYLRIPRIAYMVLIGQTNHPGFAASLRAMLKLGKPMLELTILVKTLRYRFLGWRAGAKQRKTVGLQRVVLQ